MTSTNRALASLFICFLAGNESRGQHPVLIGINGGLGIMAGTHAENPTGTNMSVTAGPVASFNVNVEYAASNTYSLLVDGSAWAGAPSMRFMYKGVDQPFLYAFPGLRVRTISAAIVRNIPIGNSDHSVLRLKLGLAAHFSDEPGGLRIGLLDPDTNAALAIGWPNEDKWPALALVAGAGHAWVTPRGNRFTLGLDAYVGLTRFNDGPLQIWEGKKVYEMFPPGPAPPPDPPPAPDEELSYRLRGTSIRFSIGYQFNLTSMLHKRTGHVPRVTDVTSKGWLRSLLYSRTHWSLIVGATSYRLSLTANGPEVLEPAFSIGPLFGLRPTFQLTNQFGIQVGVEIGIPRFTTQFTPPDSVWNFNRHGVGWPAAVFPLCAVVRQHLSDRWVASATAGVQFTLGPPVSYGVGAHCMNEDDSVEHYIQFFLETSTFHASACLEIGVDHVLPSCQLIGLRFNAAVPFHSNWVTGDYYYEYMGSTVTTGLITSAAPELRLGLCYSFTGARKWHYPD